MEIVSLIGSLMSHEERLDDEPDHSNKDEKSFVAKEGESSSNGQGRGKGRSQKIGRGRGGSSNSSVRGRGNVDKRNSQCLEGV